MNLSQSYTTLPDIFYKYIQPTPVHEPQLVVWNDELAKDLQLNNRAEAFTGLLSGNEIPEDITPIAQAYAGHQFGNFTMLGDGRAILLGECRMEDRTTRDIQLKGSGKTPFSRGGDGRAALGPMLREYLMSEAMNELKIPTTRSLAVVYTGEGIQREQVLPGAVLTRVAKSHLRVGTFQYARNYGTTEDLRTLADYAVQHFHLDRTEQPYHQLLTHIIQLQAELLAKWQLVGFVHGVMNTDNMALSGETIDYGPCAFIDTFDPATVFSSIDRQGRYAYGNQPGIAGWNLARFAESLLPILAEEPEQAAADAQQILDQFPQAFQDAYNRGLVKKIGLLEPTSHNVRLANRLLEVMTTEKADFTLTFRSLTLGIPKTEAVFRSEQGLQWLGDWQQVTNSIDSNKLRKCMQQVNPAIIPRNHLVQQALDAAEQDGDMQAFQELITLLKDPFAYTQDQLTKQQLPPDTDHPFVTYCGT